MKNKNSRLSPNKETIPERLKRLRLEAGLTGSRLAELTGTKQSRISDIENGKGYLYADELPVYASALNTTVSYLVTGNEPANETLSAELGLSNGTINRLRKNREQGKTEIADAINLLSDTEFSFAEILPTTGEYLLTAIYNFVHAENRTLLDNPTKKTGFVISLDEILMLQITKDLQRLRDEYQESRSADAGTGEPIFTDQSFFDE